MAGGAPPGLGESAGAFDHMIEVQAVVFAEVAAVVCCLLVVDCVSSAGCDGDDVVDDEAVEVRPFEVVVDWFSADAAGRVVCSDGGAVAVADGGASAFGHYFTCLGHDESQQAYVAAGLFLGAFNASAVTLYQSCSSCAVLISPCVLRSSLCRWIHWRMVAGLRL